MSGLAAGPKPVRMETWADHKQSAQVYKQSAQVSIIILTGFSQLPVLTPWHLAMPHKPRKCGIRDIWLRINYRQGAFVADSRSLVIRCR